MKRLIILLTLTYFLGFPGQTRAQVRHKPKQRKKIKKETERTILKSTDIRNKTINNKAQKKESLKITPVKKQTLEKKTPTLKVKRKPKKLKVTLLGIAPWDTEDGDDQPDYGLRQYIRFNINGRTQKPKGGQATIGEKNFSKIGNCLSERNKKLPRAVIMACGDIDHQIHPSITHK